MRYCLLSSAHTTPERKKHPFALHEPAAVPWTCSPVVRGFLLKGACPPIILSGSALLVLVYFWASCPCILAVELRAAGLECYTIHVSTFSGTDEYPQTTATSLTRKCLVLESLIFLGYLLIRTNKRGNDEEAMLRDQSVAKAEQFSRQRSRNIDLYSPDLASTFFAIRHWRAPPVATSKLISLFRFESLW